MPKARRPPVNWLSLQRQNSRLISTQQTVAWPCIPDIKLIRTDTTQDLSQRPRRMPLGVDRRPAHWSLFSGLLVASVRRCSLWAVLQSLRGHECEVAGRTRRRRTSAFRGANSDGGAGRADAIRRQGANEPAEGCAGHGDAGMRPRVHLVRWHDVDEWLLEQAAHQVLRVHAHGDREPVHLH